MKESSRPRFRVSEGGPNYYSYTSTFLLDRVSKKKGLSFLGIGVGGLINTRKIELVHMVLKDIAMFHSRHRRQPLFKCCNDLNRMKLPIQSFLTETKEKHSATVCDPSIENSTDKYVFFVLFKNKNFLFLESQKNGIIVINHFHVHQQQQLMNWIHVV
jgi:hypothetical protein